MQSRIERFLRPLELAGCALAICAMVVLGLRAALRLELRWDTFMYHLPFAARRAGFGVDFQFWPYIQACYEGLPPLPEMMQGLLWRATGSINGTGLLNYLALVAFFLFAWRELRACLWLLVLLCLTTPLVLIHAASSYVDLFTNSLLAIAVTGFLSMLLFDRWTEKRLFLWALAGMTAAVWSKFTAVPIVGLLFLGFAIVHTRTRARRELAWLAVGFALCLAPYIKNLIVHHNPTWPGGTAALKSYFPTLLDTASIHDFQTPPPLKEASQPSLFFHSLFEIGHPASYPNRERWIIDQGNAWIAYRSGGFWVIAVLTASMAAILFGFLSSPRHGFIVTATIATLWTLLSVLPESHELRYFQFLPLTVAAMLAVFVPRIRPLYPATTFVLLCLILAEFAYVSRVNRAYYRVERVGYTEAAEALGIKPLWASLDSHKTYCAVGFEPAAFLLTGPTMHEFHIVDRPDAAQCPSGTTLLRRQ